MTGKVKRLYHHYYNNESKCLITILFNIKNLDIK